MAFELTTAKMTAAQRAAWWRNQSRRDYERFSGKGVDDLGPEIRFPRGKQRCHGLRRIQVKHGDWEEACADRWYHQAHASRLPA